MDCESADTLSRILKQIDYQYEFLIGVVYCLVRADGASSVGSRVVLHTAKEIQTYLSRHKFDMIILTCPMHLPVFLEPTEQGSVKRSSELSDCFTEPRISELLLIALS